MMEISPKNLPVNLDLAHQCIVEQFDKIDLYRSQVGEYKSQAKGYQFQVGQQKQQLTGYETKLLQYQQRINSLQEQLKLANDKLFGRSSEKLIDPDDPQMNLFDEDELPVDEQEDQQEVIEQPVAAYTRQTNRGKRKKLPEYLERIRIEHKLPEEELVGSNGEIYTKIGEDISEQLDIIPQKVRVLQHVRFKYAVKLREELGVKIAPIPAQPIAKSIASSGLLAHIAQNKYCYHMPLYRQEKMWSSLDVDIPRNSMCRWMMQIGTLINPLLELQFSRMKQHEHIHVDETKVTVLEAKDDKTDHRSHQGYMWVYVNKFGTIYDYRPGRHGKCVYELLCDYTGFVQTDGYAGYNVLFHGDERISVGCMAHARRKFVDVYKASGKRKDGVSTHVLNLIARLYKVERQAKEDKLDDHGIFDLRQSRSIPILKKLHAYLKEKQPTVPPSSILGKAIFYMLNHWEALHRYTDSGITNIDNNPAERAIRPFAVGRKNWLFCGNSSGAESAANIYSLIETAKSYNLNVFKYLKHVFEQLPKIRTGKKLGKLEESEKLQELGKLEKLLPINAEKHLPEINNSS